MSRALKITGIVLGALVALVVLAVAILLLVIDPNDYKPQIAAVVKEQTGMDLAIRDRMQWSLWPSIGLKLGQVSLTDPGSHETLVAVDKAAVSVELLPLLSKQVNIDAVTLDGARVRYLQHADGSTSWDPLFNHLNQKSATPEQPEQPETGASSQAVGLNVDKLEVKNASVYLKDEKANVERTLENVAVTASDINLKQAFPLQLQFTFRQQDAAGKTLVAQNSLSSRVTLNPDNKVYDLAQLALSSALSGTALPAPTTVTVKGDVHADMGAQKVNVNGLQLQASYADKALKSPATVDMSAQVLADLGQTVVNVDKLQLRASWPDAARPQPVSAALAGRLSSNWTSGAIDAPQLAMNAVVPDKSYPRPLPVSVNAPFSGNWKEGHFSLPKFLLEAAGVRAEGTLAASLPALQSTEPDTPITKGMGLSGNLNVAPFSPRNLMAALGIALPKTSDPNVLKTASLTATIQGEDPQLLLKDIRLRLDDSTVTGVAGLSDLKTFREYARLALDRLDADRYLPPPAPAAAPNASTTPPAATPPAPGGLLPVDTLKSQNFDVALTAGALKLMTYPVSSFRVAATAGNGKVNVSELKGTVFKGGFNVPASIDVQGAQPVVRVQPKLDGMEIGPLAKKILKKDLLEGRASYTGNLTLRGNSTDAWMKSVSGTSDLKFDNGVLHGVNAMRELLDALGKYQALLTFLGKDAETIANKQNDTEIASFAAINTLDNGVVDSKSLTADLRKAKVDGSGTFNLATQDLNYRFNLNLDKSVAGGRLSGYPLPVQCKGNLSGNMAKLCSLDSKAVASVALKAAAAKGLEKLGLPGDNAQDALKQKADEEKQKAKEKLNEQLNQGLKKLFGR